MVFALSALLYFYRGKRGAEDIPLQDDQENLHLLKNLWKSYELQEIELSEAVTAFLSSEKLWNMDLTVIAGLKEAVTGHLQRIEQTGIQTALAKVTAIKQGGTI